MGLATQQQAVFIGFWHYGSDGAAKLWGLLPGFGEETLSIKFCWPRRSNKSPYLESNLFNKHFGRSMRLVRIAGLDDGSNWKTLVEYKEEHNRPAPVYPSGSKPRIELEDLSMVHHNPGVLAALFRLDCQICSS